MVWHGATSSQWSFLSSKSWAQEFRRLTGPQLPKMKLEMPSSFTDHPLSRKVEPLKSYATLLYMLSYP